MKFAEKYRPQLSSHERTFTELCGNILENVSPDSGIGANSLRRLAKRVYSELLPVNTEEGDGHLRLYEVRNTLRNAQAQYELDSARAAAISSLKFNPTVDCSKATTLRKAKQLLKDRFDFTIECSEVCAYRHAHRGYKDLCTVNLTLKSDGWKLSYQELIPGRARNHYALFSHFEHSIVARLKQLGIHAVRHMGRPSDDSAEIALWKKTSRLGSSETALLVEKHRHECQTTQYDFSLEGLSSAQALKILSAILSGIQASPRENVFHEIVRDMRIGVSRGSGMGDSALQFRPVAKTELATLGTLSLSEKVLAQRRLDGELTGQEFVAGRIFDRDLDSVATAVARKSGTVVLGVNLAIRGFDEEALFNGLVARLPGIEVLTARGFIGDFCTVQRSTRRRDERAHPVWIGEEFGFSARDISKAYELLQRELVDY